MHKHITNHSSHVNFCICQTRRTFKAQHKARSSGLVMELAQDPDSDEKITGPSRYISVCEIPGVAFPHENELLFSGKNVKFAIEDVYEGVVSNKGSHRTEINVLKKLQKTLRNGEPQWKEKEEAVFKKIITSNETSSLSEEYVFMSTWVTNDLEGTCLLM